MASAGRILIMPKGDYDANSTYENLDLVKYKGTSWLAKKESKGIEPSEANTEYWQDVFEPNIANNLTTTTEGYALDARQGKILMDNLKGYLICRSVNSEIIESIGASQAVEANIDIPQVDGYTPLLAIYASNSNTTSIIAVKTSQIITDTLNFKFPIMNNANTVKTSVQIAVNCLYVKNI